MESNSLALLDKATQMLAEVKTIDDAKNIMDIAASAKLYAQKHKLGKEAVTHAHEIEVKAEIKLGEFLRDMEKNKGGNPNIQPIDSYDRLKIPTIKELGISPDLSSEAQNLAALSEDVKQKVINRKVGKKKAIKDKKIINQKKSIMEASNIPIPIEIMLYEGDIFDQITKIEPNSVDLVIIDPPYMVLEEKWDTFVDIKDYLEFTDKWLKIVLSKLKDTGRAFIFFAPDYRYQLENLFNNMNFYNMEYGNTIIWVKKNNNKKFGRKRYRLTYEPILYLYGKKALDLNFTNETFGEMQTDVWEIATPQSNFAEGKYHPAQKPLELYRRIIITASKTGDIILDPFAGSGTTALVCQELRRKCYLIEKDAEYCKTIRGRINVVGS